jgi:hypothetical protein
MLSNKRQKQGQFRNHATTANGKGKLHFITKLMALLQLLHGLLGPESASNEVRRPA